MPLWFTTVSPIPRIAFSIQRCSVNNYLVQVIQGPWRRKWQPTPVLMPRESHGQRSLEGHSPWGCKKSDTTERLTHTYRGPASASVRLLIQSPASGGHHTGGPGNILTSSSPLLEVTTGSWEKYPPLGLQLGLDTATRARWLGCEHPKATKPDISTQGNFTLIRDRSDGW